MSTVRLSDTSYGVLGLVDLFEPTTPYELKQVARVSILHFWSIPHTQIYAECGRLAAGGLLDERREDSGRRRRVYRLTTAGRKALRQWREEPDADLYELRDPGLLKLFCGADPAPLAGAQLERHKARLHSYEQMAAQTGMTDGMRLALEAGIGHEREYVRFWSRLREGDERVTAGSSSEAATRASAS